MSRLTHFTKEVSFEIQKLFCESRETNGKTFFYVSTPNTSDGQRLERASLQRSQMFLPETAVKFSVEQIIENKTIQRKAQM